MRSFSFIMVVFFAFLAISHALPEPATLEPRGRGGGNGTSGGDPLTRTCRKLRKLTKLTDLANNQTRLDELLEGGRITEAEIEEIKTKATNKTEELEGLQSNTTLVEECAVVNAHREDRRKCRKMKRLERLAKLKSNETALVAFTTRKNFNESLVAELRERIDEAVTKLAELQTNTTLVDFCNDQLQQEEDAQDEGSSGSIGSGESSSGATGLTLRTMPYIFVPALAAFLTFFL